jgi:hypothetical protein
MINIKSQKNMKKPRINKNILNKKKNRNNKFVEGRGLNKRVKRKFEKFLVAS